MKITQDQLNEFTQWFEKNVGQVGELDGKEAYCRSVKVTAFLGKDPDKENPWLLLSFYKDVKREDLNIDSIYRFRFEVETSYPYKEEG
jgi:hypothetical protein